MENLYKIMLVDDEEEVRQGIIKKIDWKAAGFEMVGDAENGKEALERAEYLEPDVVLTDIRMPFMDGLELGKCLREMLPSIKIIIFSGFDDFEYAKQAIKLNVVEYILKPVNVEELTVILKKVKGTLDREIEAKRNTERLRESYFKNLPILKEQFLSDLVRGKVEENQIEQNLSNYNIDTFQLEQWHVCVLQIELPKDSKDSLLSLHRELELIPISVKELIEEKLRRQYQFVTFRHSGYIIFIVGLNNKIALGGMIDLFNDACKECNRILELTVTAGIGQPCNKFSDLPLSYRSGKNAVDYKAVVGSGRSIYIEDMERIQNTFVPLRLDNKMEGKLFSAIKFGTQEEISKVIDEILGKMDNSQIFLRQYQVYLIGIMNAIVQLIQQYELSMDEIMGNELDYFEILSNFQTTSQMQKWLTDICLRLNECINSERDYATKNIIKEAKHYILENYQNSELSVEVVCAALHISPAYFSTLFKKETGESYVAYLTDVRLSHAAELLNRTEDKTYIIASQVGYPETNYFSYVFKKKYGVSPTKYRGK